MCPLASMSMLTMLLPHSHIVPTPPHWCQFSGVGVCGRLAQGSCSLRYPSYLSCSHFNRLDVGAVSAHHIPVGTMHISQQLGNGVFQLWCGPTGIWCVPTGIWCGPTGIWCVPTRIWCVPTGIWCLPSGIWCLPTGIWCVPTGIRCVPTGIWCVPTGIWCGPTWVWCGPTGIWCALAGEVSYKKWEHATCIVQGNLHTLQHTSPTTLAYTSPTTNPCYTCRNRWAAYAKAAAGAGHRRGAEAAPPPSTTHAGCYLLYRPGDVAGRCWRRCWTQPS